MEQLNGKFGAIYARFSRDIDREKMERQISMSRQRAVQFGVSVIAELQEVESGGKSDRTQYQELIRLIDTGTVSGVLCQEQDRLSRSESEWRQLQRVLRRKKITVITAHDMSDFGAKDYRTTKKLLHSVKSATDEYTKDQAAIKRQDQNRVKAQEGLRYCGSAPYGYKWIAPIKRFGVVEQPGRYEVIESENRIVEELFRRMLRESITSIVEDFNIRLVATGEPATPGTGRRSKPAERWHTSTVYKMLGNPFYCGLPTMRQSVETDDDMVIRTPLTADEWVQPTKPMEYPHPVTPKEWQEIQTTIASRNTRTFGIDHASPFLMHGIVYCSNGRIMHAGGAKTYTCDCKLRGEAHPGAFVDRDVLDRIGHDALGYAIEYYNKAAFIASEFIASQEGTDYTTAAAEVKEAKAAVERIQASEGVLREIGSYDEALAKVTARHTAAQEAFQTVYDASIRETRYRRQAEAIEWVREHVEDVPANLDRIPIETQRDLIASVIERIDVIAPERSRNRVRQVRLTKSPAQYEARKYPYMSTTLSKLWISGAECNMYDPTEVVELSDYKRHYATERVERGETERREYPCDCGCAEVVVRTPGKDKSRGHFASKKCFAKWRTCQPKHRTLQQANYQTSRAL